MSVTKLKEFRDTLAHGKPHEKVFDEDVVATSEELEAQGILCPAWEAYIDHSFLHDAYNDGEQV